MEKSRIEQLKERMEIYTQSHSGDRRAIQIWLEATSCIARELTPDYNTLESRMHALEFPEEYRG